MIYLFYFFELHVTEVVIYYGTDCI